MTREEIKEHCKKQIETCEMWAKARGENPCGKVYEEHKLILELLEQEPCEDAISREVVLNKIKEVCFSKEWLQFRVNNGSKGQRDFLINYIEQLPPVTPQPKTGRWTETQSIPYLMHKEMDVPISECQKAYEVAMEYLKNQSKIKG